MEKSKSKLREEAVERLRKIPKGIYTPNEVMHVLTDGGALWIDDIIDMLTDDERLTEDDYLTLLKDAAREYQRENAEVEWQKELYRSLSDHVFSDMMYLPHDAEGEVIHIGDELQWDDGERFTVIGLGDGCVFYVNDDGLGGAQWTRASSKHHYHEPTVEDVLREFGDEVRRCCDTEDTIAEYAKKLRLKEEVDED